MITTPLPGPGHKSEIRILLLFSWDLLVLEAMARALDPAQFAVIHGLPGSLLCCVLCTIACQINNFNNDVVFVGTNVYLHIIGGVHTEAIMRAHLSTGQG